MNKLVIMTSFLLLFTHTTLAENLLLPQIEWGVEPSEIEAMYDIAPQITQNENLLFYSYNINVLEQPATLSYEFHHNGIINKNYALAAICYDFQLADSSITKWKPLLEKIILSLECLDNLNSDDYIVYYSTVDFTQKPWRVIGGFLNDSTYVHIFGGNNPLDSISIFFTDATNDCAADDHTEWLERIHHIRYNGYEIIMYKMNQE